LAASEQIDGMKALTFAVVMFVLEELLEGIGRLVNDGHGLVHGVAWDTSDQLMEAQHSSKLLHMQY
jgi:hypothetical protein